MNDFDTKDSVMIGRIDNEPEFIVGDVCTWDDLERSFYRHIDFYAGMNAHIDEDSYTMRFYDDDGTVKTLTVVLRFI